MQLEVIRTANSMCLPIRGDRHLAMIATQDIAAVATGLLLQRNWHGQSVMGLHGPTDLGFAEAATILSQELGRSIVHVPTTSEQFRASLLQTGASASGCCHPQPTNDRSDILACASEPTGTKASVLQTITER